MQLRPLVLWCGISLPGMGLYALSSHAASPPALPIAPPDAPTLLTTGSLPSPQVAAPTAIAPPERSNAPAAAVTVAQVPNPNDLTRPQPDPNRDRFPQPQPTPQPISPPERQPILPTPGVTAPAPSPTPEGPTIAVTKIEVQGSTVFQTKDFASITRKVEGQTVTLEQLRQVADGITQLYLDRGFITSRAVLVDQTVTNGIVQIQVIEGGLEDIKVEGTRNLRPSYITSRIKLGGQRPLSKDKLEDQLRLLKADPLFDNVEASLRPGKGLGQSILIVRVTEARQFNSYFSADNYSPPSVGSERLGGVLSYRNLTGIGDEVSASYYRSTTGGSNVFDFSYRVPVNPMNGTLQFRAAPSSSKITDPNFSDFGIKGSNDLFELSFRQPLIRSPRQEFALSLAFTYQNGQTFIFNDIGFPFGIGPDANGNSKTRVLRLGQDYVRRDPQGAWALRSQLNFGLDVFDATTNAAPVPDGRFFSWLAQAQRVQRLGNDHLLIAQADLQLSPNGLLPSQQFVIGGGQSVRGFRQNVRSGDNGFRFSLEDRIALQRDESGSPTLQLAPFLDMGTVWNVSDNPNQLPGQNFLAAAGLGVILEPLPRLVIRLDGALPFVNLSDRGKNAQDAAFYFSVSYSP